MQSLAPHVHTDLGVIGLSFKTSRLEDREFAAKEKNSLSSIPVSSSKILPKFYGVDDFEHAVIHTCNRSEVVYAATRSHFNEVSTRVKDAFFSNIEKKGSLYMYKNTDAISHFYKVTSGLDSMVLGEAEILGQMKRSYARAVQEGSIKSTLHRLFQSAFRTAKEIRTNTGVGKKRVSVASTAVDAANSVFGELTSRTVLIIGAGETAQLISTHLKKAGVRQFYISNRAEQTAKKIIELTGGVFIPRDKLQMVIPHVDIIAAAITNPTNEYLLTKERYADSMQSLARKISCILDLSVPRVIDPEVVSIGSTYLFNIDTIEHIAKQNLDYRTLEAARAEDIIRQHVNEFQVWQSNRQQHELVRTLFSHFKSATEPNIRYLLRGDHGNNGHGNIQIDKMLLSMAKRFYGPMLDAIKAGELGEEDLRKICAALVKRS